jgi:hypothetical protein
MKMARNKSNVTGILYRTLALVIALLLSAVGTLGVQGIRAQEPARGPAKDTARFDPLQHFPAESVLFVRVGNLSRLGDKLAGTLWGRILTHPGCQRAFAGLGRLFAEKIDEASGPFRSATGKGPLELLSLFRGEVALTWKGMSAAGVPELALAVDLGESREEILGVLYMLAGAFEAASGQKPQKRDVAGVDATAWPTPAGPVFHCVLGTHLVVVSSPELLRSVGDAFSGKAGGKKLAESPLLAELEQPLGVSDREVLVAVNLDAVRSLLLGFAPPGEQGEELRCVLKVGGIDRLSSFGYALGFEDGGMRAAFHLGMREGPSGVLGVLQSALLPLEGVDAALDHVPASAENVGAARIAPGKALAGLDRLLRQEIPELGGMLDSGYAEVESALGISVSKDLFTLGEVTLVGFKVEPPAGGLFADGILLAQTEALAPYWRLLGKVAMLAGAKLQEVEVEGGVKVEYINFGSGLFERGEGPLQNFLGGRGGPSSPAEAAALGIFLAGSIVARADLTEGWTAVSTLPQALVRYSTRYAKAPKLAADAEFAALVRSKLRGASCAGAFRGGRSLLWHYNTALALTAFIGNLLGGIGVDIAQMPPAEAFIGAARPGFFRLESSAQGLTLQTHRALDATGAVLVGGAAAAVVAGLTVPALMRGRAEALTVQCTNNLKQVHVVAALFAEKKGHWPYAEGDASKTFNQLLETEAGADLQPRVCMCPLSEAGGDPEYLPDARGAKFRLEAGSSSYEFVPWKIPVSTDRRAILVYDSEPRHHGQRVVGFTDGSVQVLDEAEFQEVLQGDREHFGKGTREK